MEKVFVKYKDETSLVSAQQEFLTKVYSWMVGGLLVTALTSMYSYTNGWDLLIASSSFFWLLFICQFALVIALSGWINKMSKITAGFSFLIYSFLTGITFSTLLRIFTEESIYTTFFIAGGMFAALSFYGFVTKKNLSGIGSFMFMGLVGIIITSVINIFIVSSSLNFLISVIGVIVFSGLTAYDTQRLKEMYLLQVEGEEIAAKGAILGALTLYLDFINLFLFLLRFLGNRD